MAKKNMRGFGLMIVLFLVVGCQKEELKSRARVQLSESLQQAIIPLRNSLDLDELIADAGDSKIILMGEGTQGTREFLAWRIALTKRLISEKGFTVVALEGDWPSFFQLNAYTTGKSDTLISAEHALSNLYRWPSWMWHNEDMLAFGEWMKRYNQVEQKEISTYGIDLFSLWESIDFLENELSRQDPEYAVKVKEAYSCLKQFYLKESSYASSTLNDKVDCSEGAIRIYDLLMQSTLLNEQRDAKTFNRLQNARVVKNAERYYFMAMRSPISAWNIRARQMMEMVEGILNQHGEDTKIIIWAHNTHVADAAATHLNNEGMTNLGTLLRNKYVDNGLYTIGFGTYSGTVTAAPAPGKRSEAMTLPPATPGSWEEILHRHKPANKIVLLKDLRNMVEFEKTLGHRAIGLVYDPGNDSRNYIPATPSHAYDAYIFLDRTTAIPEKFPFPERSDAAMLSQNRRYNK